MRRLPATVLALCLLLGACGDDGDDPGSDPGTETTRSDSAEALRETLEAQGFSDDEIDCVIDLLEANLGTTEDETEEIVDDLTQEQIDELGQQIFECLPDAPTGE